MKCLSERQFLVLIPPYFVLSLTTKLLLDSSEACLVLPPTPVLNFQFHLSDASLFGGILLLCSKTLLVADLGHFSQSTSVQSPGKTRRVGTVHEPTLS